jgi:nucleoside-diphosphate-sugar epimerase
MTFTVLGTGFIGRRLVEHLRSCGDDVQTWSRGDPIPPEGPLGHVIYTIGVTGDFLSRPLETMTAHVGVLIDVLAAAEMDSLLYLSSTRVYDSASSGREDAPLQVRPSSTDHLYNASKLAGEALCLSDPRRTVRVARLSNVYGRPFDGPNFLDLLVRATRSGEHISVRERADTTRDFVDVRDVVPVLAAIARTGAYRVYNVAAGRTVTTGALLAELSQHGLSASEPTSAGSAKRFPPISVARINEEFGFVSRDLVAELPSLINGTEELA